MVSTSIDSQAFSPLSLCQVRRHVWREVWIRWPIFGVPDLKSLSETTLLTNPGTGKTFRRYQRKESTGYVIRFTGRFRARA